MWMFFSRRCADVGVFRGVRVLFRTISRLADLVVSSVIEGVCLVVAGSRGQLSLSVRRHAGQRRPASRAPGRYGQTVQLNLPFARGIRGHALTRLASRPSGGCSRRRRHFGGGRALMKVKKATICSRNSLPCAVNEKILSTRDGYFQLAAESTSFMTPRTFFT